ncbi:hypothetical protein HPB47_005809 [Ixodes persulcatus]|uniref:Uncharacterized protein n=1 Tax=Ixodes persulcatus TaxID=34615 RepID=A0AC60PCE5_IXOPE|nr:hypothetical protein HPB47_005809 [Ixodes persulcatus]
MRRPPREDFARRRHRGAAVLSPRIALPSPSSSALYGVYYSKDRADQPSQQRTSGQAVKGVKRRKGENDDGPDDDDQDEDIAASEATSDSTMHVDVKKVAVQATIPKTYMRNNDMVTGVPDWYSDREVTEFLEPAGVIAADRLYQRRAKVAEAAKPTDLVVLTFRPNTERPVRCSRQHVTKDCKGEEDRVKCANCGGEHPASYVNCEVRLGALARSKVFVNGPR